MEPMLGRERMPRQEPRIPSSLSVWVTGRDTNGNPFKQTAKVIEVSRFGGRLGEIHCLKAPGDIIEVKHHGKRAHFRIVWIDDPSGQAGIRCIQPDRNIWGLNLPAADISSSASSASPPLPAPTHAEPAATLPRETSSPPALSYVQPQIGQRRERRYPRYRCAGGVEARRKGVQDSLWGRLCIIGHGGCYVETASPFRPRTSLEVSIGAHGVQLRAEAVVCCSHPGMGMGIMFTQLSDDSRRRLHDLVSTVSRRFNC